MLKQSAGIALALMLAGCASGPVPDGQLIADPYEKTNRNIHAFNKGLDSYVVSPAAKGYDAVTPDVFRLLIGNALDHLSLPGYFANHVLQGNVMLASETLGRFTVNTVYGAGGFLDPATELGLEERDTDFGLTLADWGASEGVYIELPALGPSTTRDAVGRAVDTVFSPTTWLGGGNAQTISYGVRALNIVDTRERYRPLIDEALYESEDSYITTRSAYIQNRRRTKAGETDVETLPDVFSE